MKKIAVVYSFNKKNVLKYLTKVIDKLLGYNLEVSVLHDSKIDLPGYKLNYENNLRSLIISCDLVLVLGGDGTIIRFAKEAANYGKPILGINAGRIGFLASLEVNQLDKICNIIEGKYVISNRLMFKVSYSGRSQLVLNEVAINRNIHSRILDYEIYRKGKLICSYRADGVIISTPTGSTAYSFSAGGPIIQPDMDCAVITPICPYSVFSRSLVVSADEKIIIKYHLFDQEKAVVSLDGISENLYSENNEIHIEKSPIYASFVNFENDKFHSVDKKILDKMF